jgi:hypothetical protein
MVELQWNIHSDACRYINIMIEIQWNTHSDAHHYVNIMVEYNKIYIAMHTAMLILW